jgi:predicted dehydrogenase
VRCDDRRPAGERENALCDRAKPFYRCLLALKGGIDSGLAGKICHAQVDSFWWRGHCYYDLWWRGTWEKEGGGCTLNHAVHHIDAIQWMLGFPSEVVAMMTNVAHDNAEVEDLSTAIFKYPTARSHSLPLRWCITVKIRKSSFRAIKPASLRPGRP